MIHRQKAPAERFDARPEFSAKAFQQRQTRPPAGEVQAERNHEATGDEFRNQARLGRRRDLHDLRAQEADDGASDSVARNAPGVVGDEIWEQARGRAADVLMQAERERTDDAAAHANAMRRAEQADEEVAYNLLAIPAAAAGYITPWMAALGMSGSSLLVVVNALRLTRSRPIVPPVPAQAG